MPKRSIPTQAQVESYLRERRTWGRWGKDDEVGAINLVTPAKRAEAARLVRSGRSVSLARPMPVKPGPENPRPVVHGLRPWEMSKGGAVLEFIGSDFHGASTTHIDALCHLWGDDGIWNGRDPKEVIGLDGASFGAIDRWGDGIVTRGVLLDIPKLRAKDWVDTGEPVHGWELEDAAKAAGVEVGAGDAIAVYCAREAWSRDHQTPYTSEDIRRPGLHASCLPFIRDHDVSVLLWDMMDARPSGYSEGAPIHLAIPAYGIALLDNALLEPLAQACAEEGRYEFMLVIAPLKMPGGTGSPVNPLALF